MNIVFLGLSITSSWGNGHAVTYRGLIRELAARRHDVLFLERDVEWYAGNRDLPDPPYCRVGLYNGVCDLKRTYAAAVAAADVVVVGSYVPDGVAVGEWVLDTAHGITAFYDIDTPVTLAKLQRGDYEYLAPSLIPRFDVYLSFTGGPMLSRIERRYGSPAARVLYCSADPRLYYPEPQFAAWDLGYLGTYSADRQEHLESLLLDPARRWTEGNFVVAGPMYPGGVEWPANVRRIEHLPPREHRAFYNSQRATLNITRADMRKAGWSPSIRLFEAASCATPIISDWWEGLDQIFTPGREILVAHNAREVLEIFREYSPAELAAIGRRARLRVVAEHTAARRAEQFEEYIAETVPQKVSLRPGPRVGHN